MCPTVKHPPASGLSAEDLFFGGDNSLADFLSWGHLGVGGGGSISGKGDVVGAETLFTPGHVCTEGTHGPSALQRDMVRSGKWGPWLAALHVQELLKMQILGLC